MSAIVLNTSGSWLVVRECSSFGLRDRSRVLLDRDIGVAPVALRWFRNPAARLPPRHGHAPPHLCDARGERDMYDELPRSQARADLEIRLVHYDFFRRDEDDRLVLLDDDRRVVDLFP